MGFLVWLLLDRRKRSSSTDEEGEKGLLPLSRLDSRLALETEMLPSRTGKEIGGMGQKKMV